MKLPGELTVREQILAVLKRQGGLRVRDVQARVPRNGKGVSTELLLLEAEGAIVRRVVDDTNHENCGQLGYFLVNE